jgi:hypothetical protein
MWCGSRKLQHDVTAGMVCHVVVNGVFRDREVILWHWVWSKLEPHLERRRNGDVATCVLLRGFAHYTLCMKHKLQHPLVYRAAVAGRPALRPSVWIELYASCGCGRGLMCCVAEACALPCPAFVPAATLYWCVRALTCCVAGTCVPPLCVEQLATSY